MALHILGIGAGDEVIVPAYTYTASASVVCHVGAKLIYCGFFGDKWEKGFKYAEAYFKKYGDLIVKNDYTAKDGFALGKWIASQRFAYKGNASKELTDEQKKRLDEIGFVSDVNEHKWNYAYERAGEYYRDNGTTKVPCGYKVDGMTCKAGFRSNAER